MANIAEGKLNEALFQSLQQQRLASLVTIDFETGAPNVSAISWLVALTEDRLVFAVDNRSRIMKNIAKSGLVTVQVIANETVYNIAGKAAVTLDYAEALPLKLAVVAIAIDEVRDIMFYGAKISVEPQYEKTYDLEAAAKLDEAVMAFLRQQ